MSSANITHASASKHLFLVILAKKNLMHCVWLVVVLCILWDAKFLQKIIKCTFWTGCHTHIARTRQSICCVYALYGSCTQTCSRQTGILCVLGVVVTMKKEEEEQEWKKKPRQMIYSINNIIEPCSLASTRRLRNVLRAVHCASVE